MRINSDKLRNDLMRLAIFPVVTKIQHGASGFPRTCSIKLIGESSVDLKRGWFDYVWNVQLHGVGKSEQVLDGTARILDVPRLDKEGVRPQ